MTVTEVATSLSGVSERVAVTTMGSSCAIGVGDGAPIADVEDCSCGVCVCWAKRTGTPRSNHVIPAREEHTLRIKTLSLHGESRGATTRRLALRPSPRKAFWQ